MHHHQASPKEPSSFHRTRPHHPTTSKGIQNHRLIRPAYTMRLHYQARLAWIQVHPGPRRMGGNFMLPSQMAEPPPGAQCAARVDDHGDAASNGRDDASRPGASNAHVSYARDRLLASKVEACEGSKHADALPAVAHEQSAMPNGGAMQANFSAPCRPLAVGKAPQQKCIAWRSRVGYLVECWPID